MVHAIITRIAIAIAVLVHGPDFGCSNSSPGVAVAELSTSSQLGRDICPFLLPIQLVSISLASSIVPVASQAVGDVAGSSTPALVLRNDVCPPLSPIQRTPIVSSITTLNDLAAALGQSGPAAWKADRTIYDDRVAVRVVDEHYSIWSRARFYLQSHLPRSDFWLQTSTIVFLVALTAQSLIICWLISHGRQQDAGNAGIIAGLRNQLTKKSGEYIDLFISKCEALRKINEELDWSELAYNTDRACMRNIITWHKDETTKLQGTVAYLISLMEILQHALNTQMGINTGLVDERKKAETAHQATFDEMLEAQLEIQALQAEIRLLEDELEEWREREVETGQHEEDRTPTKYTPQASSSGTARLFAPGSDSESPAMTSDSSDCDSDSDTSVFSSSIRSPTSDAETSWLKTRPEWAEASIKFRGGKRRPRLPSHMMESAV